MPRHLQGFHQTNGNFLGGKKPTRGDHWKHDLGPLSSGKSSAQRMSSGRKRLLWRERSLQIRRELLSKSVEYDGIQEDIAECHRQLGEVRDLLQQEAA